MHLRKLKVKPTPDQSVVTQSTPSHGLILQGISVSGLSPGQASSAIFSIFPSTLRKQVMSRLCTPSPHSLSHCHETITASIIVDAIFNKFLFLYQHWPCTKLHYYKLCNCCSTSLHKSLFNKPNIQHMVIIGLVVNVWLGDLFCSSSVQVVDKATNFGT